MPATAGNEQILVASKLMQYYRVFSPVSAVTSIQAVNDSSGNLQLISLGNDNNLYNVYPSSNSDTGWQVASLNTAAVGQGGGNQFCGGVDRRKHHRAGHVQR